MTANCFHPGLVASGFNRNNGLLMSLAMTVLAPVSRSSEKGAETLVWLATSPQVAQTSGAYFVDERPAMPSPAGQDREAAQRLWDRYFRRMVGLARAAPGGRNRFRGGRRGALGLRQLLPRGRAAALSPARQPG